MPVHHGGTRADSCRFSALTRWPLSCPSVTSPLADMLIKLRRWFRTTLERIGIHLPFAGVICVEGTQTISIDEEWRASITTRRRLVFTEPPASGDLCDTYALGLARPIGSVFYSSPDAVELGREERVPGRLIALLVAQRPGPPLHAVRARARVEVDKHVRRARALRRAHVRHANRRLQLRMPRTGTIRRSRCLQATALAETIV